MILTRSEDACRRCYHRPAVSEARAAAEIRSLWLFVLSLCTLYGVHQAQPRRCGDGNAGESGFGGSLPLQSQVVANLGLVLLVFGGAWEAWDVAQWAPQTAQDDLGRLKGCGIILGFWTVYACTPRRVV